MQYFHLKIVTNNKNYIFQMDLTKEDIVKYATKYLSHNNFFINGYNLNFSKIIQFRILQTTDKIKNVLAFVKEGYRRIGIVCGFSEFDLLENREYCKDITNEIFDEIEVTKIQENDETSNVVNNKDVFIVRGHDTAMLVKVENFLRKIDLNPIILHEQPNEGKTIIEKIEKYSKKVCYAIILYSPCDKGCKSGEENNLFSRARQNVVFEHGYMMALLGRPRVCALLEDDSIERPSDISGIVYIPFDENKAWEILVAKEMLSAGIKVDFAKLLR